MKSLNWLLYEVHRWLGVLLGLFMFVWLFSGILIMYAAPNNVSRSQWLAHAEILNPQSGWLSLGDAWKTSRDQRRAIATERRNENARGRSDRDSGGSANNNKGPAGISDARLISQTGEPVWLVDDTRGQRFALSAVDGSVLETSAAQALKIASLWQQNSGGPTNQISYLERVDHTIMLNNRDALQPFHRIAVGDDGDQLLISARTGEVLLATSRWDRAFYWAGNWIHMFKPLDAIGLGGIRHDVQLWSGLTATIACLTGMIIGWIRWRPGFNGGKTYSQGRTQPYREFWLKWHFWTGLLGGTIALLWAFSGFLSSNPGKIFSQGDATREELGQYLGKEAPEIYLNWHPAPLAELPTGIVELNWRRVGEEAVLLASGRDGKRLPLTVEHAQQQFSDAALQAAVRRISADAQVQSRTLLTEYDSYYFPNHHQGLIEKPLPVLLVELADQDGTLLYIDPVDGRLLSKLDKSRRWNRWLSSGLHHWNFGWLYYRPVWDIWMLFWVGFGLVLSASSLVIGWRRLQKTFTPKKHRIQPATQLPDNAQEASVNVSN